MNVKEVSFPHVFVCTLSTLFFALLLQPFSNHGAHHCCSVLLGFFRLALSTGIYTFTLLLTWLLNPSGCSNLNVMGWTVSPQSSCVEVLDSNTSECNLIWRQGLYRGGKVNRKPLGWALIQYNWYFYKKGEIWTQRHIQKELCEETQGEYGHL